MEDLPPQFVTSLRVLFDILDEEKCGLVKLSDLEYRWEENAVTGLPVGVIDSLHKVTPANGKLTFERFVTGLRLALLKHRNTGESTPPSRHDAGGIKEPKLDQRNFRQYSSTSSVSQNSNTVNVDPNGLQQRTASMPVLQKNRGKENLPPFYNGAYLGELKSSDQMLSHKYWNMERRDRKPGDGRSSIASASALEFLKRGSEDDFIRKGANKRREPRRHTLANGVDYNMVKRMKQLEQEKQMLNHGLSMIMRTKEWYQGQLQNVDDKMKALGRSDTHGETTLEANEERLSLQSVRIQELNHQLQALVDSSHKGFALHMNLAVTQSPQRNDILEKDNVISMLKSQNRMLTKEVSDKSDRIAQLDKEKTQLIRKMFEATSENHKPNNYDDTTFI